MIDARFRTRQDSFVLWVLPQPFERANSSVRGTVPYSEQLRVERGALGDRIDGRSRPGCLNRRGGLGAPWDGGSGWWTITHRGADSPPPDDLARAPVDRRGDLATGPSRTSPA